MSEPVTTTATVTESGGGPDIQPPSIGGAAKPFEGMDGKRYEPAPPPPAAEPRPRRRRAAPAESLAPTDAPPAGPVPATAAPATQPQASPQDSRPGLEALRHPGESDADFYPRIHQEDRARIQRFQRENEERSRQAEGALREAAAEIHRLRSLVEPVVNRQVQQEELRQREELMSQIPDPEAGPEERERYNTMVLQALLQRQQAMEAQLQNNRTQDQQQAIERQQQDSLEAFIADRDESIGREMNAAFSADPALAHQVQAHLQLTAHQFRQYDPSATEEEIEELVYLTHLDEMVQARARGMSPADYYRQQAMLIQQTARTFGMQPAPQQVQQQPAPAPQNGSPTAAQVAREATRAGTATGGPGRPGGAPGGENLPTRVYKTEDEYLRAGLRKEFDEDWIRLSLGRPAGEGGGRRRR
jgi:hypothetical protein